VLADLIRAIRAFRDEHSLNKQQSAYAQVLHELHRAIDRAEGLLQLLLDCRFSEAIKIGWGLAAYFAMTPEFSGASYNLPENCGLRMLGGLLAAWPGLLLILIALLGGFDTAEALRLIDLT
jgi:hypothetical protein